MVSTDAAYLAGLLDGEGCIHAAMIGRNKEQVQLLVEVWNTHKGTIDHLHEAFGGHRGVQDRSESWKPVHFWRISIGGVRKFLPEIAPYMRIKRDQAEVALELANLPATPKGQRLSDDVVSERRRLVGLIQAFNKRGR
jgi:hypothetical protein